MADDRQVIMLAAELRGLFSQESIDVAKAIERLSRRGPAMRPLTVALGNDEVTKMAREWAEHLLDKFGKGSDTEIITVD
jgi:hypothetical protein